MIHFRGLADAIVAAVWNMIINGDKYPHERDRAISLAYDHYMNTIQLLNRAFDLQDVLQEMGAIAGIVVPPPLRDDEVVPITSDPRKSHLN